MGAWSHEPFGNDDAQDWVDELNGKKDLSYIEEALDNVLENDGYLEAPEACQAIAAVEVIAKLLGKGTQTDSYAKSADRWVESVSLKPSPAILAKARQVLIRIAGKDSELQELWQESDDLSTWQDSINALQNAVNA